ncbi:MAG: PP2C family protein-serine/threonine phosphatase [bacterium]
MPDVDDTQELPTPNSPGVDKSPASWTAGVRVECGAATDVGKVRANNEDHYLITRLGRTMRILSTSLPSTELSNSFEEAGYALVVADGMGGMAAGEVASSLAIMSGIRQSLSSPKWSFRIDDAEARELVERVTRYFEGMHAAVTQRANSDAALSGMGTTLTVAYSAGFELFTFHVGDSRAYLFRDGRLQQITRDHTVAQMLEDAGSITHDEAAQIDVRHVLTNAVGGGRPGISPHVRRVRLADGDAVLLCTDGLTEMVTDDRIAEILAQHATPNDACNALVGEALANGGHDNVTVLLARYSAAANTAESPD